jgi:hypothetical protein
MYTTTQGLPVDPHQVQQWAAGITGLPNSFPFVPPTQLHPSIQPYGQFLAGLVLLEAQNHAGRNPLRTFTYNLITVNGCNNPNLLEMVQTAGELAEFFHFYQRKDIQVSLREAAGFANSAGSSLMMEKFPMLKQYLSAEQQAGASQWIETLRRMIEEINRSKAPVNPNGLFGQQGMQQPAGLFTGQGNPGPTQAPSGMATTVSSPGGSGLGGGFWDTSGYTSAPKFSGTFGGLMGGIASGRTEVKAPDDIEAVAMFNDTPFPMITRNPAVADFTKHQPAKTSSFGQAAALPDVPSMQNEERPWDRFKIDSGAIIVPVHLSTWKVSKTEERPYKLAYNPVTHCLFHGKRPDGIVEEVPVPWDASETMDYLKNELRSDMKAAIPKDPHAPRVDPNYNLLTHMTSVTDNLLAIDTPLDPVSLDTPPLEMELPIDVLFVSGFEDLKAIGRIEASVVRDELVKAEDGDPDIVNCTEHYGDITRLVTCNETDVTAVLDIIRAGQTIEGVMADINASTVISQSVRTALFERLTDEINIGLRRHLQTTLLIDSVSADYADLMKMMNQVYGQTMVDLWKTHELEMIGRAFNLLSGDRLIKFLTSNHGDKAEAVSRRVLVFVDRASLTYVDWNSSDMDLAFVDSGALSEATMPNLYRAIKGIFRRISVSDVPFAHVLMVTNDDVMLEFHQGWLGKGFYLISKH